MLYFVVIIILINTKSIFGWTFDTTKESCGVVYSEPNYSGEKLSLYNSKTFNDLSTVRRVESTLLKSDTLLKNESWDKQIKSIKVENGCKLYGCSEAHLEGKCSWLKENKPTFEQIAAEQYTSIACGCLIANCKEKKCAEVIFRDNECGRAYFETNCTMCKGEFLTIKEIKKSSVGDYMKGIKSINIKPGCTFKAYANEDFDEEAEEQNPIKLYSEYKNNWDFNKNPIESYTCECEFSKNKNKPRSKSNNPNDPPLIDIPTRYDELLELSKKYPDHPGVVAALTSIRHERSPHSAYILIIGLTGSGKSSTINFLFDREVAKAGSTISVTGEIHEYTIPVIVNELGCKNCELRVIDTPGFGDTGGLEKDSKFIAGLEEYLKTHKELQNHLPNVVLVFSKFTDNRIKGNAAPFVKTLRGIEIFKKQLFDKKFSNVVTVLTHYMGETKAIQKNPANRINQFRKVIEDYTTFTKPIRISVAENKVEDYDLPIINGYYKLPNKEYYPQNIFEKIQDATGIRDPIGEAIIRNAFKRPEDFNITEDIFWLSNKTFNREQYFLGVLNAENFNIKRTEVSNITERVYNEEIDSNLRRKHEGSLEYVQRILNLQNIFTREQVPRTTVEIVKLFKNIRLNPVIEELLKKSFSLITPEFSSGIIVGQGYKVLTNEILTSSIFDISKSKTVDIGYKIPDIATCKLVNEPNHVFQVFVSKDDYLKYQLSAMKVDTNIKANLRGDLIPGFNTKEDYEKDKILTAVRELRLFQLTLFDNPPLSYKFLNAIKAIAPFTEKDIKVVEDWKDFFNKYGTHVVKSVYGGGGIEGKFKIKTQNLGSEQEITEVQKSITDFFTFLKDISLAKPIKTHDIDTSKVSYSLNFYGGDLQYQVNDFSQLDISKTIKIVEGFEESLTFNPKILKSTIELIPISAFVKKDHKDAYEKIVDAAKALFNSSLSYKPPPPELPPLERPEVKSYIKVLKDNFDLQINILKDSLKNSSIKFEKFTEKLIEENNKEREEYLKKLKDESKRTKESIALTCAYSEPNYKGDRICTADMVSCLNVSFSKKPKSVNTHNACIRIYNGHGCTGTNYKEIKSTEDTNTAFPYDTNTYSVIRCDFAL